MWNFRECEFTDQSLLFTFFSDIQELASPKNPVIEESLSAMLTPYVVSKMGQNKPEEVLKLLNSNVESPYLIWDNGTRAELTDFLENERTSSVRR